MYIHIHTYTPLPTGILLSNKKERNSAICNNMMDLEGVMLSEMSQTENDKYWMSPFTPRN